MAAPPRQKSWTPCRNRKRVNSAKVTTFLAPLSRAAPYCKFMSVPYLKEAAAAGEMEKLIRFVFPLACLPDPQVRRVDSGIVGNHQ